MKKLLISFFNLTLNLYCLFYLSLFLTDYSFILKKPFSNISGFTGLLLFLALVRWRLDKKSFSGLFICKRLKGLSRLSNKFILGIIFAYIALMLSLMGTFRHLSMSSLAWDMGIFDQALWNTLQGDILFSSLKGNMSLLGDHFEPVLFLLVPFYRLWPHPLTLVIVQALSLAVGALGIYLLARDKLANRFLIFSILISYAFSKALRGIGLSDFHPEGLMVPASLFAFYALLKRKNILLALMVALLLSTKETAVFMVAGLGLYAWLVLRRRFCGVFLIGLSLVSWIAETCFIIPYFNSLGQYPYFVRLPFGKSYAGNFIYLLVRPWEFVRFIFMPAKTNYLFKLGATAGFLPFLAPAELILIFFPLLTIILGDRSLGSYYLLSSAYVGCVLGFVYIGAIYGAANLLKIFRGKLFLGKGAGFILGAAVLAATFFTNSKSDAYKLKKFIDGFRKARLAEKISYLSLVPKDASLAATANLVPHLAHRRYIYALDIHNEPDFRLPVNYIVIDQDFQAIPPQRLSELSAELSQRGYERIFSSPGDKLLIFFNPQADQEKLRAFRDNLLL